MSDKSRFLEHLSSESPVDALVEQALDLSADERRELIETLLFFDAVMSSGQAHQPDGPQSP